VRMCIAWYGRSIAIARTPVGGRLTVRTPHLAVPTRFQDGVPATPAEPSVMDLSAGLEPAAFAFGGRLSHPLSCAVPPPPAAGFASTGCGPRRRTRNHRDPLAEHGLHHVLPRQQPQRKAAHRPEVGALSTSAGCAVMVMADIHWGWCIPEESNLDPDRNERPALPLS
jgi:hypothetical protein